jgi:hypothetical protein
VLFAVNFTNLASIVHVLGAVDGTRVPVAMIHVLNVICITMVSAVAELAVGVRCAAKVTNHLPSAHARVAIIDMMAKIVSVPNSGSFMHATVVSRTSLVVVALCVVSVTMNTVNVLALDAIMLMYPSCVQTCAHFAAVVTRDHA